MCFTRSASHMQYRRFSLTRRHRPHRSPYGRGLSSELFDMILDYLHDDKESLLNCCFAGRVFVQGSRFHMFREILVTAKCTSEPYGPFLLFLGRSHLGDHIRTLTLSTKEPDPDSTSTSDLRSDSSSNDSSVSWRTVHSDSESDARVGRISTCFVLTMLRLLPNIRELSIQNCTWIPCSSCDGHANPPGTSARHTKLQRLALHNITSFHTPPYFSPLHLLHHLHGVHELELADIKLWKTVTHPRATPRALDEMCPEIEKYTIAYPDISQRTLSWFKSEIPTPHGIRHLVVRHISTTTGSHCKQFIRAAADTVVTLELRFTFAFRFCECKNHPLKPGI